MTNRRGATERYVVGKFINRQNSSMCDDYELMLDTLLGSGKITDQDYQRGVRFLQDVKRSSRLWFAPYDAGASENSDAPERPGLSNIEHLRVYHSLTDDDRRDLIATEAIDYIDMLDQDGVDQSRAMTRYMLLALCRDYGLLDDANQSRVPMLSMLSFDELKSVLSSIAFALGDDDMLLRLSDEDTLDDVTYDDTLGHVSELLNRLAST